MASLTRLVLSCCGDDGRVGGQLAAGEEAGHPRRLVGSDLEAYFVLAFRQKMTFSRPRERSRMLW
jgi:hypothetical protein